MSRTTRPTLTRRKALALTASLVAATSLAACGGSSSGASSDPLTISASPVPHAEILKKAQELGLLGDTKIEVKEITGDLDANQLLVSGDVDANFFQHVPYEKDWAKEHDATNLVDAATVHVEPLGLYSRKVTDLAKVPQGATVAVPNNVTNYARALLLLQQAKLITLDVAADKAALSQLSEKNIASNPKGIKFTEVSAEQLPRTLDDGKVDLSVINGNYALEAGLTPSKDSLALESATDNPYANVFTTTTELKDDPRVKAVAKALVDPKLQAWIKSNYNGSVLPAATS